MFPWYEYLGAAVMYCFIVFLILGCSGDYPFEDDDDNWPTGYT